MKVRYWKYDLKFRHPFTISKGTKTHQPTFIVELENFGWKGHGEAPAISYYNIPVEKMIEDLERKKSFVEKFALQTRSLLALFAPSLSAKFFFSLCTGYGCLGYVW
jgi:L-alanine-DL-glutamate epimerase-like enolase superfamily enzyme